METKKRVYDTLGADQFAACKGAAGDYCDYLQRVKDAEKSYGLRGASGVQVPGWVQVLDIFPEVPAVRRRVDKERYAKRSAGSTLALAFSRSDCAYLYKFIVIVK